MARDQGELLLLIREARALGIDPKEERFIGNEAALEDEIKKRNTLARGTWEDELIRHKLRRLKLGAAYLAGASLNQLAYLEKIATQTMRNLVHRAGIPRETLAALADERRGRPSRRSWVEVTAMLRYFDEHRAELASKNIVVVAGLMREHGLAAVDVLEPEASNGEG